MQHSRKLQPQSNRLKSESANKKPSRQDVDVSESSSNTTHDSILNLQRLIGNQAVQRLIAHKTLSKHTIQLNRQPYGLETKGSVDQYTDYALKLRQSNPKMLLKDFANKLTENISQELDKQGVPQVKMTIKAHLHQGEFKQDSWELIVDPAKFDTQNTGAKELGQLSVDDVINATGTVYHEARHADQDFLVARMLAGKNKTPAEIHKATVTPGRKGIPLEVAKKAVGQKLINNKSNEGQIDEAETLFAAMYGEHKALLHFVIKHGAKIGNVIEMIGEIAELDDANKAVGKGFLTKTVAATRSLVAALNKWSKGVAQPEIKRLDKKAQKSPLDTQMLNDLTNINTHLDTVSKEWQGITKPDVDNILDFGVKFEEFYKVFVAAYQNIPSEKDAFAVEGMVKSRMEGSLKAKSKDKGK